MIMLNVSQNGNPLRPVLPYTAAKKSKTCNKENISIKLQLVKLIKNFKVLHNPE